MSKITYITFATILIVAVLAADSATLISSFKSRSNAGVWAGTWAVDATKVAACKAQANSCCFTDSVKVTAVSGTNSVVISGDASGTNCPTVTAGGATATTLNIKIEGTAAETDLGAAGTVTLSSEIGGVSGTYGQDQTSATLLVDDGSALSPPTYAVRLQAKKSAYTTNDALNYIYVNNGKLLSASILFIIAVVLTL